MMSLQSVYFNIHKQIHKKTNTHAHTHTHTHAHTDTHAHRQTQTHTRFHHDQRRTSRPHCIICSFVGVGLTVVPFSSPVFSEKV